MSNAVDHTLLVCTVGGTPQAIAAAIKGCRPDRIVFIVSPETCPQVEKSVIPLLRQEKLDPGSGQFELVQIANAQDFAHCVEKMREIGREVAGWLRRGADYGVVVDITGGTKCMSAALALVARLWPCHFSYVGGAERTKGSVGVVVNGTEQVFHTQNPWDSLGYQAMEEALVLFDGRDYQAAIDVVDRDLPRVERSDLKRELSALRLLTEAYLAWDLFDHADAHNKLRAVQENANNLRHILPGAAESLLNDVQEHRAFLSQFKSTKPGSHVVLDLCANAQRCAARGRYDDAVARLYRAMEATAQIRLNERHGIANTSSVPLDKVPRPLKTQWAGRARKGEFLLGLQDDYVLLKALGDELGQRFYDLGLAGTGSPLSSRNQSILAHGFEPVGDKVFADLWDRTLALTEIDEGKLPSFPRLGPGTGVVGIQNGLKKIKRGPKPGP